MQGEGTSRMSQTPRRTASSHNIKAHTSTHVFEIDDYSQKKETNVGEFIRSSTFTVGGFDWSIHFYPNGIDENSKDDIIVFLELMSSDVKLRAHYNIQFIGEDDGAKKDSMISWYSTGGMHLFKSKGGEYRPRHMGYLMRDSLEEEFVKNNHLTIQCDLTVIRLYSLSENRVPITEIPVPPSDIKVHFGKLLEDKKGADVTFVVGCQTFDAHKAILAARSPVFMEELYGLTTRDIGAGPMTVENMNPLVFRDLLHFIYTDTLAFMCDPQGVDYCVRIIYLLVAANRYAMDRLKLMCEDILTKMLNKEAAGTTLDIAQSHSLHKLKEDCIEFMASQCERDVVQACTLLKRSCPSFVTAVLTRKEKLELVNKDAVIILK
ncbi:hypothetical protein BDA96_07G083900 [Sorghum bicolor]|uniref:BTB domain-containing protein n=1 Tax=Sorghum bicolor TaxID=4558 RepID=A0A921QJ73_SORBI|nr:hypothetical protein BDA96_07G083900 [Sorghum bicolor]